MASKPNTVEKTTEKPADAPAATAPASDSAAPVAAPVGQAAVGATKEGNVVKLANGERRVDYIKRRFAEGASRGTIAKELGVPYQIVFASTKKAKADAATAAVGAQAVATPAPAPAAEPAPAAAAS